MKQLKQKYVIASIEQVQECPDCASSNIVRNMEREQIICRECGVIYEPLTPEKSAIRKPASRKKRR